MIYLVSLFSSAEDKIFGNIHNGEIILTEYGKIVEVEWHNIAIQHSFLEIGEYAILPDQLLSIINFKDQTNKTLDKVLRGFKVNSLNSLKKNGLVNFKWRKSFYKRNIRDELDLNAAVEYIDKRRFSGI